MTVEPVEREGFLLALIAYALDGVEPEKLTRVQQAMFILCKPTADSGRRKSIGGGHPETRICNKGEKEIEKETEKETETETEGSAVMADREVRAFERFWELYPSKVDRDGALQAWEATTPESGVVMEGLKRWRASPRWEAEAGRYVPRAAKFLREKHYLAAPEPPAPVGALGELGQAEVEAIRKLMEE